MTIEPPPFGRHYAYGMLAAEHDAEQVGLRVNGIIFRREFGLPTVHRAGVVDDRIDAPKRIQRPCKHRFNAAFARDIRVKRYPALAGLSGPIVLRSAEVGGKDAGPLTMKHARDRTANARASTRNDRNLAREQVCRCDTAHHARSIQCIIFPSAEP